MNGETLNGNTSSSMDESIKATFDMLVERISNVEERIDQLHRAAVFAECCKYGQLNNEALGYPFEIIRAPQFSQAPCNSSMQVLLVQITTNNNDQCGNCDGSTWLFGTLVGEDTAERLLGMEDQRPRSLGWNESRFGDAVQEAVQRYIDTLFENSEFECTLLENWDSSYMLIALSHKSQMKVRLDEFLQQIPRLPKACGHTNVNCIEKIEISTGSKYLLELVLAIQNAANLPDGPLREIALESRGKYSSETVKRLAREHAWVEIEDVCMYLKTRRLTPLELELES